MKPHRAESRDNNAEVGAIRLQTQNHQGLTATPEPERKARNRFSPTAFREHDPADNLTFEPLASRNVRIAIALSHLVGGASLWQHLETNTGCILRSST